MKVCVFGQMHNGKTTYANMLAEELATVTSRHFYVESWARAVKDSVANKFGLTFDFIQYWKNNKETPPGFNLPMREILQLEGETARQAKTTVWIDKLMGEYASADLVIDDGRYANEAEAIHTDNGFNILIIRPGYENDSTHPSECAVGGLVKAYMNKTDVPPAWSGLMHSLIVNNSGLNLLREHAKFDAKMIHERMNKS